MLQGAVGEKFCPVGAARLVTGRKAEIWIWDPPNYAGLIDGTKSNYFGYKACTDLILRDRLAPASMQRSSESQVVRASLVAIVVTVHYARSAVFFGEVFGNYELS
jgi:hypothetical protein